MDKYCHGCLPGAPVSSTNGSLSRRYDQRCLRTGGLVGRCCHPAARVWTAQFQMRSCCSWMTTWRILASRSGNVMPSTRPEIALRRVATPEVIGLSASKGDSLLVLLSISESLGWVGKAPPLKRGRLQTCRQHDDQPPDRKLAHALSPCPPELRVFGGVGRVEGGGEERERARKGDNL
jgi:hypothetical protein